MGNSCISSSESIKAKKIDLLNRQQFNEVNEKIKLLLLGAGESGKSTLFKQMRILYGKNSFTENERKVMIPVVHQNIVCNLAMILNKDPSTLKVDKSLVDLWQSQEVQNKWNLKKRSDIQVQDCLEYFMCLENLNRILTADYLPTDQDILRCRVRTSGIVEEEFEMEGAKFQMVDVGGQRTERRKWIHAFEDVDCILFVAAISEYDQVLYEDNSVQRQTESLQLFHKISNEQIFNTNSLILFLNKTDLFKKKLLTIPFRDVSKKRNLDYTGPTASVVRGNMTDKEFSESTEFKEVYAQSLLYLEHLYRQQLPHGKNVYVQTTCATDTQQIKHIMSACKDILLKKNLKQAGFAN